MTKENQKTLRLELAELFIPLRMTNVEFNLFSKEIVGVEIQSAWSRYRGFDTGVDNALRGYAANVKKPENFYRLIHALRERAMIRGIIDYYGEDAYRRLVAFVKKDYDKAIATADGEEKTFGGKGYGVYDRVRDERTDAKVDELKTDVAEAKAEATRGADVADEINAKVEAGFKAVHEKLDEIGDNSACAAANSACLVRDREGRRAANAERGRASYETGDGHAERERAAADMERALERVRKRMLDRKGKGERAFVIDECRDVCKTFKPKSTRKDALGRCEDGYYLLTGADGNPIQPETLARRYRERYGTEREVLPVGWRR